MSNNIQKKNRQRHYYASTRKSSSAEAAAAVSVSVSVSSSLSSLDSTRHVFHTKMAIGLTIVTLFGLGLLSVLFGGTGSNPTTSNRSQEHISSNSYSYSNNNNLHRDHRHLDEIKNNNGAADDGGGEGDVNNTDYSSYSCHDLFDATPNPGDAQCAFARTCNQGSGLWAPFVFCSHNTLSRTAWLLLLSPIMLTWLLLLFRMLGSTAEDYFSPALEMFSNKLGLPPRFAGVTLLALGNGAADVSATVSAIGNDPQNGYKLSLGALTGAAMVIGSVVSALVVLVAGGVPCRGALVRDVTALGICVLIVWKELGSGTIGPETVTLFLSLYAMFVVLVLVADVYHRAVVLPRKAQYALEMERQRQLQGQQDYEAEQQAAAHAAAAAAAAATAARADGSDGSGDGDCELAATHPDPLAAPATTTTDTVLLHAGGGNTTSTSSLQQPPAIMSPRSRFSRVLTAFSNYDNDPMSEDGGWGTNNNNNSMGVDSDDLAQERPILLHGSHGILNPHNHTTMTHADGSGGGNNVNGGGPDGSSITSYAMLEDAMDRACTMPGSGSGGTRGGRLAVTSWKDAFEVARIELYNHAEQVWDDIAYNGDVDFVTKCCLILELPFTIARKMTVVIPCEGYYVRAMIALSLALSPLWFAFYMYRGHEVNLLFVTTAASASSLSSRVNVWFLIYCFVAVLFGLAVLRFAPAGDDATGEMSLLFATPIALYGFIMAATWIDTIADSLVSLLDFIGIVLYIPGPIVGLTILAWGNSMSDLSADVTMARKGLANMAMTACFAGPFFNILVGLGLGFYSLEAQTGQTERQVELSPSITVGFLFITINSAVILLTGLGLGKGRIPKKYGYIALTLYSIYLITSISLQYKYSQSGSN